MLWSNVYKWIFLVLLPARNSQGAMVYCSLRIYRHCTWRVWKRLVVSVRLCFPVMVAIVAFSWRHGHAHAHVLALSATFLHKFTIFNFEVDLRRHESTTASERERELIMRTATHVRTKRGSCYAVNVFFYAQKFYRFIYKTLNDRNSKEFLFQVGILR